MVERLPYEGGWFDGKLSYISQLASALSLGNLVGFIYCTTGKIQKFVWFEIFPLYFNPDLE